jgi:hypothetical protein
MLYSHARFGESLLRFFFTKGQCAVVEHFEIASAEFVKVLASNLVAQYSQLVSIQRAIKWIFCTARSSIDHTRLKSYGACQSPPA